MMPLDPTIYADLVEGAARQGLPLTADRARHLESLVHESSHAQLLGIQLGRGLGPEITARLEAMSPGDRDANEIDTLATEVAVFREWEFIGDGVPGFLETAAHAMALATGAPEVEEMLIQVVMDESRSDTTLARARHVIRDLAAWVPTSGDSEGADSR